MTRCLCRLAKLLTVKLLKLQGLETDETGYIKINIKQETNIPGVYAAGDVTTHPVKQVGTAVGQGITAALEAYGLHS